ncbi:hypothetical protein scyTo_0018362 [Scyliorhinus torazame]|uniref:Ig-like domain-containing protein n=1 Tax=Scyliorhinus torazame TaxID=75743 RepID=A0A401PU54_SCYTO|nr:hypothetical protein [Scyliorhinus torazame]
MQGEWQLVMGIQHKITYRVLAWTVTLILNTVTQDQATVLKVSSDHVVYTCPEGLNVTLKCSLSGHLKDGHDRLAKLWYFSHGKNATCAEKMHIRNTSVKWETHNQYKGQGVYMSSDHKGVFWVTVTNLVPGDQGVYCCVVHELHRSQENKHHPKVELTVHGTMELKVIAGNGTRASNQKCTFHDTSPESDTEVTAVALATMGCVIGILSLPLIMLLIYKQREGAATRRTRLSAWRIRYSRKFQARKRNHEHRPADGFCQNPIAISSLNPTRHFLQILRHDSFQHSNSCPTPRSEAGKSWHVPRLGSRLL